MEEENKRGPGRPKKEDGDGANGSAPATDTVTLSKTDFASMMKRLEALEGGVTQEVIYDPDTERSFECRVVTHEGKPVHSVKSGSVKQVKVNERGESVMTCDIFTLEDDGSLKEYVGVDYNAIRRRDSVKCKLISTNKNSVVRKGSVVDEQIFNESTNKMVPTGRKVRLIEKVEKNTYTVDFGGREIELGELNISGN